MFVFLHRRHPGHVVEGDDPKAEVRVVRDAVDEGEEIGQGGCGCVVDVSDEVCGRQAILVGGRTASLEGWWDRACQPFVLSTGGEESVGRGSSAFWTGMVKDD